MGERLNQRFTMITVDVLCSDELSDFEKILFSMIMALTKKNGYCYATNGYLANILKKGKSTVSKSVGKLIELGFLDSEILYKDGTKEIQGRLLFLASPKKRCPNPKNEDTPILENEDTLYSKMSIPPRLANADSNGATSDFLRGDNKNNNKKILDNRNLYNITISAREKNQTSLNAPALKENPNENFKNRPLNENQVGYGVEKPNVETKPSLTSKPTLEAKPSLVATKSNATSDYVSYTSPKNYATEKEWYEALKMTDLMGWNIEGILYTHLIPYLEDKRGRPLQDFEIKRISAELAKYVGVSQLEIVRRCIKGGFREIKPFGTDKLRKDYPDMCWELGDNYEI